MKRLFRPVAGSLRFLKTRMTYRLKPIGLGGFLLGTDELGRDSANNVS